MKIWKIAIMAATLITATVSAQAETTGDSLAGFGGYSEGYRMGRITKMSIKGMIVDSGEGELMMGKDSDVWATYTKDSNGKQIANVRNPWAFSTSKSAAPTIMNYQGKYVWVKYQESMVGVPSRDTKYSIIEINNVTRQPASCKAVTNDGGLKSNGTRTGRIVKASLKGNVMKTWEVTIHMGGKNFIDMSISDEGMYNCAVEWLKSGKEVNLHYVQKAWNVSFDETDYRVIKIEGADDL